MPTVDTLPLIFVMGVTNVGKSTLMDTARGYDAKPDPADEGRVFGAGIGLIEVGKMMRAKYPPEHFKGQGAPAHTQVEAWQMLLDSLKTHVENGMRVAIVDGQPRNLEQCEWALAMPNPKLFLHLWAPPRVREARAAKRDVADPDRAKLTAARLTTDLVALYDVMMRLQVQQLTKWCSVQVADTSQPDYVPWSALRMAIDRITLVRF